MNTTILKEVTYDHPDFLCLCSELDAFLNHAIGGESKREKYKKFNCLDTMDYVVLAYDGEQAVGCAALRKYSADEVELKRVFVRESCRGQGVGGMLLEHLIAHARQTGYSQMVLETGEFLAASVRLYLRYGFEQTANYGAYRDMKESLCMRLHIDGEKA